MSIKPVLKFVNCLYAYCSENNNLTFHFGGSRTPGTPSGSAIVMHASFVSSDQWYLKELIIIMIVVITCNLKSLVVYVRKAV